MTFRRMRGKRSLRPPAPWVEGHAETFETTYKHMAASSTKAYTDERIKANRRQVQQYTQFHWECKQEYLTSCTTRTWRPPSLGVIGVAYPKA